MLTSADNWVTVPTNSILTIHKQTVMVHPIIDEYYNQNPAHHRSSKFVAEKGLITNTTDKTCTTPPVIPSKPLPATPSKHTESPNKHMSNPSSSFNECHLSPPFSSRSVERSNENSNGYRPISSIPSISSRDPTKPQEQGNTKKKRVSIEPQVLGEPDLEFINGNPLTPNHNRFSRASATTTGSNASGVLSPTRETGYGSPAKINQYFPELS